MPDLDARFLAGAKTVERRFVSPGADGDGGQALPAVAVGSGRNDIEPGFTSNPPRRLFPSLRRLSELLPAVNVALPRLHAAFPKGSANRPPVEAATRLAQLPGRQRIGPA